MMFIFTKLYLLITILLTFIKRFAAKTVLTKILGWNIIGDYRSYEHLRTDKHVIIYINTSYCELIIGSLLSICYDIPITIVVKKEHLVRLIIGRLLKYFDIISIDRDIRINTTHHISNELQKRYNFVFCISLEARGEIKDAKNSKLNTNGSNSQ